MRRLRDTVKNLSIRGLTSDGLPDLQVAPFGNSVKTLAFEELHFTQLRTLYIRCLAMPTG